MRARATSATLIARQSNKGRDVTTLGTNPTNPTEPSSGSASLHPTPAVETAPAMLATADRDHSTSTRHIHGRADLPKWRDRLGAVLLSLCAAGALVAAISAVTTASDADTATEAVETWRMVGYVYFAGIFMLLALAPRQLCGLWELTIVAKLALPLAGATFLRGSTDAGTFVVVDGIVTVVLIGAYVLMARWRPPPRIGGRRLSWAAIAVRHDGLRQRPTALARPPRWRSSARLGLPSSSPSRRFAGDPPPRLARSATCEPGVDVGAAPQTRSSTAEVDDRAQHFGVATSPTEPDRNTHRAAHKSFSPHVSRSRQPSTPAKSEASLRDLHATRSRFRARHSKLVGSATERT